MARIFTSGFETQSAANGVEWYTTETLSVYPTINTNASHVASGDASLRVQNATAGQIKCLTTRFTQVADGVDLFCRVELKIATGVDVASSFIGLGNSHVSNAIRVVLTPSRTLRLEVDAGSSVETVTGTTVLATGQYYRIEFRMRRHATTPNAQQDQAELRINGNAEISGDSFSIGTTPSRLSAGINLLAEQCATCDLYLDDVALNDSTGLYQASWPGPGHVVMLKPNAEGEFGQTVTKAGSSPTASFWGSLNDLPVAASDGLDFLTFTAIATNWAASGSRVAVALESMPSSPGSVALVAVGARVQNQSSSTSGYALSAQTSDGGTKPTDHTVNFAHLTEWVLNSSLSTRAAYPFTMYRDPSGAPWTETTINALQLLVRAVDAAPNFSMTALWATVEYRDDIAPGTPGGIGGLLLLGAG